MHNTPYSLLERLADNNAPGDWDQLDRLYRPLLMKWVARMVPQSHDADDVVQETLSVVAAKLGEFRQRDHEGSFRSWLRAIMVLKVKSFWRARERVIPSSDPTGKLLAELEQEESALSRIWDEEHNRFVLQGLLDRIRHEFNAQTWKAFDAYVMRGESPAVVASNLTISVNSVFIARSRVLMRLREEAAGLLNFETDP